MDGTLDIRRRTGRSTCAAAGRVRRRTLDCSAEGEAETLVAVRRAQAGDREAVRELYERFAGNVYGYVCSIVGQEHDAEDVTQQVFTKLLTSLGRYEPTSVPFAAWILRVARNAAVDHLGTRRATPHEEVRSPDASAPDSGREQWHDLRAALDSLPPDQRRVAVMRFVVGLSPAEIAHRMGRTENAVNALGHRSRRRLCEELTARGAAPMTLAA